MDWFEVVKIRDETGGMLRVRDYYQFIKMLRIAVQSKVKPFRNQDLDKVTGKQKAGTRKSYVNINRKKGVQMGGMLTFKVSGLNASSGERYQYDFTLKEDDEGDYVFLTVTGPDINYQRDTVIPSEIDIITNIAEVIGRLHDQTPRKTTSVQTVQEEMIEGHEEDEQDIQDFSAKEQRMRREAEEEEDDSKTPEGAEPGKTWSQRFRGWRDRLRGN